MKIKFNKTKNNRTINNGRCGCTCVRPKGNGDVAASKPACQIH